MLNKTTENLDRERHMSNYNLEVLLRKLNRKATVIMWIQIVFCTIILACCIAAIPVAMMVMAQASKAGW